MNNLDAMLNIRSTTSNTLYLATILGDESRVFSSPEKAEAWCKAVTGHSDCIMLGLGCVADAAIKAKWKIEPLKIYN